MRRAAVFEEEDPLPGAELHPALGDRDHLARPGEDGTNMRGAVVAAFRGMLEPGRVFRHQSLDYRPEGIDEILKERKEFQLQIEIGKSPSDPAFPSPTQV